MLTFVSYPVYFSFYTWFANFSIAELNEYAMNMVMGNMFTFISKNKSFQSISTKAVEFICFFNKSAFFFSNWSFWTTDFFANYGYFSCFVVVVPNLINTLFSYACNLSGLVFGSSVIEHP